MDKYLVVWLDHETAVMIKIQDSHMEIFHIHSQNNEQLASHNGNVLSESGGHHDFSHERKIERRHGEHLHHYYQNIIHNMKDIKEILILGPGEAKFELENEMAKFKGLSSKIISIQSTDKLSENQIVSKARKFFNLND